MRLTRLYIRFFRSFNLDYERKARSGAEPNDWERIGGAWYPFVRVDIDAEVTAIVGANESGKSHLVEATVQALTDAPLRRDDFCRYSALFSVEKGELRIPDLGVQVELQDDADVAALPATIGAVAGDRVLLMRFSDEGDRLQDTDGTWHDLTAKQLSALLARAPRPFKLLTDVPLPDSVSLDELLGRDRTPLSERSVRRQVIDALAGHLPNVAANASAALTGVVPDALPQRSSREADSAKLACSLILDVAKVDRQALEDLERALRADDEGQVGGLVNRINLSLSRHLNFSRWWTQDREFQLRVEARERELVFKIRDRTGTDYSFEERSRGLTYFLSYFVQLRAHQPQGDRPDVLLMDEPDAYLSSSGQLDLLRALEHFARPEGRERRDQVIYVTHSPFLINRNAAHRIRVLDKGTDEEGTRVVKDVARTHYEPLRSSFGAYVAETAFIGGSNLLVEGPADQVLLTGMTNRLRSLGVADSRLLDLNDVTVVPCGSANSVPYMAYLARGRDEIKPACVALLDGDTDGRRAAEQLRQATDGAASRILHDSHILIIADIATSLADIRSSPGVTVRELEDLIPIEIAAAAARGYSKRLIGADDDAIARITSERIVKQLPACDQSVYDATKTIIAEDFDRGLGKVGFAKEVVRHLEDLPQSGRRPAGVPRMDDNFRALIESIRDALDDAVTVEADRLANRRSDHIVKAFIADHPQGATRDQAARALRQIDQSLENSLGDEAVRRELDRTRATFGLSVEPLEPVADFPSFAERLRSLKTVRLTAYHRDQDAD